MLADHFPLYGLCLRTSRLELRLPDSEDERQVVQGELAIDTRQRLTRVAWQRHRTVDVDIDGLQPCRGLFGLA